MNRLIRTGLIYGNLIRVDTPALVERYNRALQHLIGKRSELTDFHVDISGYSPEVADELGDTQYLNHNGVNRQFILLTTRQKTAPLLEASFSTTRAILRKFIDANEAALFALTARDAVAGELVNGVFLMDSPAKLMDVRRVTVEADTASGTLRDASALSERADRFLEEEDAWFDDKLIAEMIELAHRTGDVTRNPVQLKETSYTQDNFWTSHLGGAYLFSAVDSRGIVARDPAQLQGSTLPVIGFDARRDLAAWLHGNGLVQPLTQASGVDAAAILRRKMDFIVVDTATDHGQDLAGATDRDLRQIARRHASELPETYHQLRHIVQALEEHGRKPRLSPEDPAYFYALRAADCPEAELVNRLLAELCPLDILQLFICHKELFYQLYRGWSEAKKSYAADMLARDYLTDKTRLRESLFGHGGLQPPQDIARPGPWSRAKARPKRDPVAFVGPWGAVIRERD